jgi:hypothetical protein
MGLEGCKTNVFDEMVLGTKGRRVKAYLLTPWSRVLLEKLTSELCS